MATCKNCKANFGCGCQLTEGLCAACYGLLNKAKSYYNYAISKIN